MERLLRATADAETRHFWFRGFRLFVTPLLQRAAAGRPHLRLLDCGCGTGNNLDLLNRFGHAYGVDLTDAGLRIGREAGRRGLARATVATLPFARNAFDIVTSFDVLYSLPEREERQAVAEMHRVTKPGGFVLINVAAMPLLHGNHSVLSHELRRYSLKSLSTLVASAGFAIDRITYTNAILFVPMTVGRALQRWCGLAAEAEAVQDIRVPPAPVNLTLTALLRAESLWLRAFDNPFGSSLLCLAKKPA